MTASSSEQQPQQDELTRTIGNAAWIWSGQATRPYHNVVAFRRTFRLGDGEHDGRVAITADSRYDLFVNGAWVGTGPARAWSSPWSVDQYDVSHLLRPGAANVVAVLVQHFGIGTFQYLHCPAGLLASVRVGGQAIVTDATWRARPHEGFRWPVPRISCMQPWEEQFDARVLSGAWTGAAAFDDAAWSAVTVQRRAGEGPHDRFVARAVPQLTRDPVPAVRVQAVDAVRSAPYQWTLNPRDLLNPTDRTADHLRGRMLLLTHIHSDAAADVTFHPPHTRPNVAWKLNGELLKFDDHSQLRTDNGVAHARLRAGWNTLMARLPEVEHYWWAVLNAWCESPIRLAARPDGGAGGGATAETAWLAVGPFDPAGIRLGGPAGADVHLIDAATIPAGADAATFEAIWERGALTGEQMNAPFVRPMPRDAVADADVYARCASDRTVDGVTPRVDNADALLHDNEEWATIHPINGADARVLLDFGREVVGHHEFEIDAPAGTVVDVHNFEFIQPDGRFNLAEGMNNSFRYVCGEGINRYRTLIRRGFRYSWVTFRDHKRPVRVRLIRMLMSAYPQARQGAFACSDPLLERIWEVGAHSVHCCSEDTYTDCPTYEQTFWVGDARNEAMVDLVVNGDPRLSAHSWELAGESLQRSPLVESQVPSAWQNVLPAWSFLWMRWAQEHYTLTGDAAFGRRALDLVDRNVAGITSNLSPRGLFRYPGWNMFDWAPVDAPNDNSEITHLNCLAVLGLRQCAQLAADFGDAEKARRWGALADRLARAVNEHLWDEAARAYVDCIHVDGRRSTVFSQQTHTAAFIADVPTADRKDRCWDLMTAPPKGFVTAGSPFFMFFMLEGLVRRGDAKRLLETIADYWGKQVEAGATTFWETYAPDEPRMTRSHCHGWSAAPTFFLSQQVLGVQPLTPGYARTRVAPQPAGLAWARGRVPTPHGAIECGWTNRDGKFSLRLVVPPCVSLEILAPGRGVVSLNVDGTTMPQEPGKGAPIVVPASDVQRTIYAVQEA